MSLIGRGRDLMSENSYSPTLKSEWMRRICDTLILRQCDRGALQLWSPTGVKLMEGCDARAVYGHIPSQLPNEIPRPGEIQ